MSNPLVTVTAYAADEDARTAQGALGSAGIAAVLDPAPERVKVRVEIVEALRAGDVLNAQCPTLADIDEADEDERDAVCPACGAPDVAPSRRGLTFALVSVLAVAIGTGVGAFEAMFFSIAVAGVFLLTGGRRRCTACAETFD